MLNSRISRKLPRLLNSKIWTSRYFLPGKTPTTTTSRPGGLNPTLALSCGRAPNHSNGTARIELSPPLLLFFSLFVYSKFLRIYPLLLLIFVPFSPSFTCEKCRKSRVLPMVPILWNFRAYPVLFLYRLYRLPPFKLCCLVL